MVRAKPRRRGLKVGRASGWLPAEVTRNLIGGSTNHRALLTKELKRGHGTQGNHREHGGDKSCRVADRRSVTRPFVDVIVVGG